MGLGSDSEPTLEQFYVNKQDELLTDQPHAYAENYSHYCAKTSSQTQAKRTTVGKNGLLFPLAAG